MTKMKMVGWALAAYVCVTAYNIVGDVWTDHQRQNQQAEAHAIEVARVAKLTPEQRAIEATRRAEQQRLTDERAAAKLAADNAAILAKRAEDKEFEDRQVITFAAVKQIIGRARDPQSVTIHDASYIVGKKAKGVCVEYGARNGFGGMNREFMVTVVTGDILSYHFNEETAWNNTCVGKGYNQVAAANRATKALLGKS